HILIIGGGIGGLALAQGLKKHGISFHVYERDSLDDFRAQGYRIRIAGPGADALEYLFDEETMRLYDLISAETHVGPNPEIDAETATLRLPRNPRPNAGGELGGAGPSPRRLPGTIDRTMLRAVLLRGITDHVSYGKNLQCYEIKDGGVTASFSDGSKAYGTLLVGADGKNSHVRRQFLPNHRPLDTDGRCIYGKTLLTPHLRHILDPMTLGNMCAIKDRSRSHFVNTICEAVVFPRRTEMRAEGFDCPDDYMYWVMSAQPAVLGLPSSDDASIPHLTSRQSEALALSIVEKWHPSVKCIVSEQLPGSTALLTVNAFAPELPEWTPNPHVTLLGDAVHLMGPTAGSGAVTALRDCHVLCKQLVEAGVSKESIGRYEGEMRQYARKALELSWSMGRHIFGQ
ncbi:hypothetical protein M433DRAFT_47482, partial [Acidomyces richmondensis BFW]